MDDPAIPAAPEIPSMESEESQPIVERPGPANEGAVPRAHPSSVVSQLFATNTPNPALVFVKNETEERSQIRAVVTGSETTGLDARSSSDPASDSNSGSQSVGTSSRKQFSVHRRQTAADFVIDRNLPRAPPGKATAYSAALLSPTPDHAPVAKMQGVRRRLDPYTDPYDNIPVVNRLRHKPGPCADLIGPTFVSAYPVQNGWPPLHTITFKWTGLIGGSSNGKTVYGAISTWGNESEADADAKQSLSWFPRQVAVKMVSKVDIFEDTHAGYVSYGTVVNEAAAMKALSLHDTPSAFVNGALATFQDDNFFYIVSRRYSCSLEDYIRQTRPMLLSSQTRPSPYTMDPNVFRFYAAELLLGMEYLEQCGVVNRDIKLANVFVSPSGHLALADFDLAVPDVRPAMRAQNCRYEDVRIAMNGCGTAVYEAPERLLYTNSKDIATPRADIWSLGITLLEFALQMDASYFIKRFPQLFLHIRDQEEVMEVIFKDSIWTHLPVEARDPTGSVALDPSVHDFLHQLLTLDPNVRVTVQVAKQHKIFAGLDWEELRGGAINPPLLAQDCHPVAPAIDREFPKVERNNVRMKHLQRSGMLSFSDFGSDWIAPKPKTLTAQRPEHGVLPEDSYKRIDASSNVLGSGRATVYSPASHWQRG